MSQPVLTAQPNITQNPNILQDIFENKLQINLAKILKTTSVNDQINIILGITSIVMIGILYFGYHYWIAKKDKYRTLNFLKITFLSPNISKPELGQQIYQILTGQHQLLGNQILTFEIHKPINDQVAYYFSCQDLAPLNYIKSNLQNTLGLNMDIVTNVPIQPNNSKTFQLQLIPSQLFGNFRTDDFEFIPQTITQLNELSDDQYGFVVIAIRTAHKTNLIKSKITSLNYKASSISKKMGGIDHNLANDVKQLQTKNNSLCFSTKVFVQSSNKSTTNSLAANFNLVANDNYFVPKLSNASIQEIRFVPNENILMPLFQKYFGKYLNARELSCLIQFSNPKMGFDANNSTTVSDDYFGTKESFASFDKL